MHYVKHSKTVLAWSSCHCAATKSHYKGEEKGPIPRYFYRALRVGGTDLEWMFPDTATPSVTTTESIPLSRSVSTLCETDKSSPSTFV